VQLRAASNGETSATVSHCLAAGVPVIVTAIGSAKELPDNCAIKVERDVSPDELADDIQRLLGDHARRATIREAGLRYAREHSFERVADELYREVASSSKQAGQVGSTGSLAAALDTSSVEAAGR
jgi:glycosyltransferase involved in cell wall biosynthesis